MLRLATELQLGLYGWTPELLHTRITAIGLAQQVAYRWECMRLQYTQLHGVILVRS